MKMFFVFMFLISSAYAQEERVIKVIRKADHKVSLTLEKDTFIPNIQGYSCAWPGVKVPHLFGIYAGLRHGNWFQRETLNLKRDELDHRFCGLPTAQEVFGEDYVIGKHIELVVTVELALIQRADEKLLREKISSTLLGVKLESIANLKLGNLE